MDNKIQEIAQSSSHQWLRILGVGFGIVLFGIAIGIIGYILGAIKTQSQPNSSVDSLFLNTPVKKESSTADWTTYDWRQLTLKYPSSWTVEKIYYSTPAQQTKGESPEEIGVKLFPGREIKDSDFIQLGGRQISCEPSENHVRCSYTFSVGEYIYTDSTNPEILKVFSLLVATIGKSKGDETSSWKTYRNNTYGFEVKYPYGWREKPNIHSGFLKNIGFIQEAYATVSYEEMLTQYTGTQVFDIWFQNPMNDKSPVLGEEYKNTPQYYQYSNYNGAPLGIFIYVFKNGKTQLQNGPYKSITVDGISGYRSKKPIEETSWATEIVEVQKNNNLFLIFYAGEKYRSDFDNILSTLKFTP